MYGLLNRWLRCVVSLCLYEIFWVSCCKYQLLKLMLNMLLKVWYLNYIFVVSCFLIDKFNNDLCLMQHLQYFYKVVSTWNWQGKVWTLHLQWAASCPHDQTTWSTASLAQPAGTSLAKGKEAPLYTRESVCGKTPTTTVHYTSRLVKCVAFVSLLFSTFSCWVIVSIVWDKISTSYLLNILDVTAI